MSNITPKQKENWLKLIDFMRKHKNKSYNHNMFVTDFDDTDYGCCAGSIAFMAGIVSVPDGFDDRFYSRYTIDMLNEAFGEDAVGFVFDRDNEFCDFIDEHEIDTFGLAADALENHLKDNLSWLNDDNKAEILYVMVTWKNGAKDKFPCVGSLVKFLELNPHRKPRKVVQVKNVARTVYDQVESVIHIPDFD